MQAVAGADVGPVGRSPALDESLARAHQLAVAQGHAVVGLEHLLFALTDDPDGTAILDASNISIEKLRADVSGFIGRLSETMPAPPGVAPQPGADLLRILQLAGMAARQSQRRLMDGAIVLAAIIGDGNSPAAGLLKAHGLTFEAVIRVLSHVGAPRQQELPPDVTRAPLPPPKPESKQVPALPQTATEPPVAPPPSRSIRAVEPPSAEAMLASVRARVKQAEPPTMPVRTVPIRPAPDPVIFPQRPADAPQQPAPDTGGEAAPPLNLNLGPPQPPSTPPRRGPTEPQPVKSPGLSELRRPAQGAHVPASPPPLPSSQGAPRPAMPGSALPQATQQPSPTPPGPQPGVLATPPTPEAQQAQRMLVPQTPLIHPSQLPNQPRPQQPPDQKQLQRPTQQQASVQPRQYVQQPPSQQRPMTYASAPAPEQSRSREPAVGSLAPAVALDLVAAAAGLPATMRIGVPVLVEVRIPRDQIDVQRRRATPGAVPQVETPVYRAITVRLGTGGVSGLAIEPRTPETIWLEPGLDRTSDAVVWQFVVTPATRGSFAVTLAVTGRTISPYGVSSDAGSGSEQFAVKVKRKRGTALRRLAVGGGLFAAGVLFAWYAGASVLLAIKTFGGSILR